LADRRAYSREWEELYRDCWRHDKVVRTTHGVNCTGSCSWKVDVKDGLVTWETQQTDYPSNGPDVPEYEPRGCPRGASGRGFESHQPAFRKAA
jgi:nitrate reductase / nitrite oxidoreductase, alpha subunit